jgi:hypothetical protein
MRLMMSSDTVVFSSGSCHEIICAQEGPSWGFLLFLLPSMVKGGGSIPQVILGNGLFMGYFVEDFKFGDFGNRFFERPTAQARTSEKKLLPKSPNLKSSFCWSWSHEYFSRPELKPRRTYNENFQPATCRLWASKIPR